MIPMMRNEVDLKKNADDFISPLLSEEKSSNECPVPLYRYIVRERSIHSSFQ